MRLLPLLTILLLAGCSEPTEQPLAFDHKVHKDADVDCSFCHEFYETTAHSGIPTAETCTSCHDDDSEHPELQRLARYVAAGEEIPWIRLYAMPGHVFYSHRRHVVVAEIACSECHGNIGETTQPPRYALVHQSMDWCMSCHEEQGASTECIHCHR